MLRCSQVLTTIIAVLIIVVFCVHYSDSFAAEKATLVFRGARIHTVSGPMIESGTLVVQDGQIAEVGPSDKVAIPAGAKVIDASGKVIIPGLIDSHSHLGVYSRPAINANSDGNEGTEPVGENQFLEGKSPCIKRMSNELSIC